MSLRSWQSFYAAVALRAHLLMLSEGADIPVSGGGSASHVGLRPLTLYDSKRR